MRIRLLEIHGFKSFVDRMVFRFGEGVSGVVGPNGCGKSNILDAIQWVMGEQNPRSLRGLAMADIIFNGSANRAPVGMAEVSMTFTNAYGPFSGAYAALSEVQITRRLYRSGESEYLINRLPCRLRDIQDLFMDTGAGTRAYSVIEQGRVGQIVSARAIERRKIIEEAAGITRYKARRDEALKQLDRTTQNLERIGDLVTELRRQMKSLERQAKKAQTYQGLRTRVRLGELVVALLRWGTISAELAAVDTRGQSLLEEEQALLRAQEEAEARLQEIRDRLGDQGRRLGALKEKLSRAEGTIKLHENTLALLGEQAAASETRQEELRAEQTRLQKQLEDGVRLRKELTESQEALDRTLGELVSQVEKEEGAQIKLAEEQELLSKQFESGKSAIVGHLTSVARLRNNLANLERRDAELEERLNRNKAEESRLEEHLRSLELACEEAEQKVDAQRQAREMTREAKEELEEAQKRLKADIKRLEQALAQSRDDLASRKSRLKSLKDLERNLEGFGEGVRTLLREYHGGLVGTVADMVDTRKEYEAAVEAVAGSRLQCVVVESLRRGLEAGAFLKAIQGGRAGFIPLDIVCASRAPLPAGQGIVGPLIDFVRWTEGHEAVVRFLFDGVVLVDSLEDGMRYYEAGHHCTFVTRDGELLEASGVLTGGSPEGTGGILRKKGEMKELAADITRLDRHRMGLTEEFERLQEQSEEAVMSLEALREKLHAFDLEIVELDKDLKQTTSEMMRERSQLKLRGLDARSLGAQLEEIRREEADAKRRLEDEEGARLVREDELDALEAQLKKLTEEMNAARDRVTGLKIRLTEARSSKEENGRALERLVSESETIEASRKRVAKQAHEVRRAHEKLEADQAHARAELAGVQAEVAEVQETLEKVSRTYGDARRVLADQEVHLGELRHQHTEVSKTLAETARRSSELGLQREHIQDNIEEKFGGPLAPLWCLFGGEPSEQELEAAKLDPSARMTLRDAETNASLTLEAGIVAQLRKELGVAEGEGVDTIVKRWEKEISEARESMSRLGEVNLAAMEEYRTLEERFDFTSAQEEDLQKSITSIKAAITRINRKSREQFRQAFDAINVEFQRIFPKLFGGGSARLELSDETDLLETGVEIIVQPPGKRLQNVNLLSGGEKAMSAVALIFAVFLIRPSPFCILDEVDAPLDDVNSGRFHEVIRELSALSQFIVITHNKQTMEIADTLYGVTMDEPGVSRLVTVDLRK